METKAFRAKTLHDALQLVQQKLGPQATVLQTREVWDGWLSGLFGGRKIEIIASADFDEPIHPAETSSLPEEVGKPADNIISKKRTSQDLVPRVDHENFRQHFRDGLMNLSSANDLVPRRRFNFDELVSVDRLPDSLFDLFTTLVDAGIDKYLAEELVHRARALVGDGRLDDLDHLLERLTRGIEGNIRVSGPITVVDGQRRVVALIGPTGVGKTTTIAKLAANFRLREKKQVGLITVDTYRIAAVDQLRTYADIIDLPMEVIATPREMSVAIQRMADLELVFVDTAGRGPADDVKLQELRTMLNEAQADEVHLVLSAVTAAKSLCTTANRFKEIGATHVLLTKLDEASGLGNLIPLFEQYDDLALSYLTNGQNVPDDIQIANSTDLATMILGDRRPSDQVAFLQR